MAMLDENAFLKIHGYFSIMQTFHVRDSLPSTSEMRLITCATCETLAARHFTGVEFMHRTDH